MNTLSHKFEVKNVSNYKFADIKAVLSAVFFAAFHVTNETVSEYHNFNIGRKVYKETNGESPNNIELIGYKNFRNYASNKHKDRLAPLGVGADAYAGVTDNAIKMYDKKKTDIFKGNAVIPQVRRDSVELNFRGRSTVIDGNVITTSVLLPAKAKELNPEAKNGKVAFVVDTGRKGNGKKILDRIQSGEYKLCDSCIKTDGKNGYYIKLSYQVPSETPQGLDEGKTLGIDLGIANAAVLAVDDKPANLFINGGEIEAFRRRIEGRRKSMRNQLRVCSDNRKGHGRATLLAPLDVLSTKVADFKELTNHRYSKKIVDFAIKNGCGTIQMEDLSGIGKQSSFLANWSYFDLQSKIEYKAKMYGIKVVKIKPQYTSQRCNKCGCIDTDSRPDQSTFKCTTCGEKCNADLNAARNIAIPGIEKIIAEQIKIQRKYASAS